MLIQKNKRYIYGLSSIAVWGCLRMQKISDEYVIKKRMSTHVKVSVIKETLICVLSIFKMLAED